MCFSKVKVRISRSREVLTETKRDICKGGLAKANDALHVGLVMCTQLNSEGDPTISSVQTLLIHTLSLPSTPLTLSSSTPSHQQRRAGFLQNRSSFCAIPTALLLPRSLPLMSVLRRARAMLQMTALLGSPARCPHRSSWLNPLPTSVSMWSENTGGSITLRSTSR